MNKETIAEELVCLLDTASRPQDIAPLKADIASFFIVASVRIDLIAKVMDLDNDIGTYNFDIPLLENTQREIRSITQSPGMITFYFRKKQRKPYRENFELVSSSKLVGIYERLSVRIEHSVAEVEKLISFSSLLVNR